MQYLIWLHSCSAATLPSTSLNSQDEHAFSPAPTPCAPSCSFRKREHLLRRAWHDDPQISSPTLAAHAWQQPAYQDKPWSQALSSFSRASSSLHSELLFVLALALVFQFS